MVGGSVAAVDDESRSCMQVAAVAGTRLLRFAVRARQQALDRIAAVDLSPSRKHAMVAAAGRRIARAQGLIKRQVQAACPDATFASVYGRSLDTFLTQMGQRADCLSENVYVQNAVTCPAPKH
jgi:hypothetical protein